MREIKFRAWDKVNFKMVYKDLDYQLRLLEGCQCEPRCKDESKGEVNFIGYPADCPIFAMMQYTGLKDKNGQDIYEGDIVVADWHWIKPHVIELPDDYDFIELINTIEILGNKYENPEC